MTPEDGPFLSRWSRRKALARESALPPTPDVGAAKVADAAAQEALSPMPTSVVNAQASAPEPAPDTVPEMVYFRWEMLTTR